MGAQQDLIGVGNFLSANVQNLADILTERWTPKKGVAAIRITVALGTEAQFGFTVSNGLTTTPFLPLKDGVVLGVNKAQTFTIGVRSDYSYQFKASTATFIPVKIQYLTIEEVSSGEL